MSIERAHVLTVKVQADTMDGLGAQLRILGDQILREGIGVGVSISGGPSSGYVAQYRHNEGQTHDEYFRQIEEELSKGKSNV
jgi:hypothetical protein